MMNKTYKPKDVGIFNGPSKFKKGRLSKGYIEERKTRNNFTLMPLSQGSRIKREVPDFNPALEFKYTKEELKFLTEKILLEDEKPRNEYPAILLSSAYNERIKREIYTGEGTPDPSILKGLYWRTHPNGRPVSSERRRKLGDSFYRR